MGVQTIGLIALGVIALDIWAGVLIVQSHRSLRTKLTWLAIVLLLPIIGVLVWLVAGPRPDGRSG